MIRITDSQDTLRSESGVLDCSLEVVFMTNHNVLSWSRRMYQPQRMRERERQCTYNVTLRRVHESLLPWRSNMCYLLVCVCVRACMWIPGCVAACMRVRACSLANPACNAYAPYCDVICGPSVSATFVDIIS
jgi:hypothetical protein